MTRIAFPGARSIACMVVPILDGEGRFCGTSVRTSSEPITPGNTMRRGRKSGELWAGDGKDAVPLEGAKICPVGRAASGQSSKLRRSS